MIQMNDFRAEPDEHIRQEIAAVERVLRSGWYILGGEVKAFESSWAARCGTRFAVGVGNGMDAIEIGLRALGIGNGDEVVTTPMTAFATVLAIIRAGAEPVLADIDPETALLDPDSVRRCISPRTKAVLLVHLYGHVRSMDRWTALCQETGIALLEDCAQSHAASSQGMVAGSFGSWGAYSFYPTKNLGAIGDGGALVTNSEEIADRARVLRNYGQSQRYHHPELGLNSRLDELHAAILSVRLEWLDAFTERRREIARWYDERIDNALVQKMIKPARKENHVYHLYVVRSSERERLASHLQARGVSSLIHYPIPVHLQKPCHVIKRDPYGLKHAERHAAECLSIPCHPQMKNDDINKITDEINQFK